jgi:ubiquinone/menaquinone biosynthesis C-methylase UbiE
VGYLGVDASPSLIKQAKLYSQSHTFILGDVTQPIKTSQKDFSHATIILALQNIEHPHLVLNNAKALLKPQGKLLIVLNHPCFRIPRQSSWGVDEAKKLQYRRLDRYLSPLKIPIQTHPGKQDNSQETWSFHHSLSDYALFLKEAGFSIELIEEWVSDKTSTGAHAKMENRSRCEFPLFLTLLATSL